ncbi:MAG: helix-turn-helix domain-containing protein [Candidatus Hodarchaeota archaeon]
MMFHTYKIRIIPNPVQQKLLWDLSEKCRTLYNFALQERRKNWYKNKDLLERDRKYIGYFDQQNQLPRIKRKYPNYGWVYSKVFQMTLKKLDNAFKSFIILKNNGDKTARPPRFRGKDYFFTLC